MKYLISIFLDFIVRNRIVLSLGLFGFTLFHGSLLLLKTSAIETDLRNRVFETLKLRGFARIQANSTGRDITLSGEVSSESAAQSAIQIAEAVWGVRKVRSQLGIKALRLPHLLVFRTTRGALRLEGELPNQNQLDEVSGFAKQYYEHETFSQSLRANPEVTNPKWYGIVPGLMQETNQLQSVAIEFGAGTIAIGGLIESEANYRVFNQRMTQFIDASGHEYINRVGILPDEESLELLIVVEEVEKAEEISKESTNFVSSASDEETLIDLHIDEPVVSESGTLDEALDYENDNGENRDAEAEVIPEQEDDMLNTESSGSSSGEVIISEAADTAVTSIQNTSLEEEVLESSEIPPKIAVCNLNLKQSLSAEPIVFSSGSAKITVNNSASADNIANILEKCPTYSVLVSGHTDSSGNVEANQVLSQLRAERVRARLVERGVEAARITAQGFGSSQPVASNETLEGRNKNRRIEIVLK